MLGSDANMMECIVEVGENGPWIVNVRWPRCRKMCCVLVVVVQGVGVGEGEVEED